MQYEDILDKVKGLSDLLWAVTAQSENYDCLRSEGLRALASLASDIEKELEASITNAERRT